MIDNEQVIGLAILKEIGPLIDLDYWFDDLSDAEVSDVAFDVGKAAMGAIASLETKRFRDVEQPQFIYFIGDGSAIKIGISVDPQKRLRSLQTSHPSKLELLATVRGNNLMETYLHGRFRMYRLSGEWFRDVPELREYISGIELSNSNFKTVQERLDS